MFEKPPPREITELINFPQSELYQFDNIKFYNKTLVRTEKRRRKYQEHQPKPIEYNIGDQVLLTSVPNLYVMSCYIVLLAVRPFIVYGPTFVSVSYTHLDVYKRQH